MRANKFNFEVQSFGFKWWSKNKWRNPTPNQIIIGIETFFIGLLQERMNQYTEDRKQAVIDLYRNKVFKNILLLAGITKPNEPILNEDYFNPEHPVICLVLWFYSIEPSFYAALNDSYYHIDNKFHQCLGPFAIVLFWIVQYTEEFRFDRIPIGLNYDADGPLGKFN